MHRINSGKLGNSQFSTKLAIETNIVWYRNGNLTPWNGSVMAPYYLAIGVFAFVKMSYRPRNKWIFSKMKEGFWRSKCA